MIIAVIIVATIGIIFILALGYFRQRSSRSSNVPGLDPSSKKDGNLVDIQRTGTLHEFLMALHRKFGPIASFWMGRNMVVSIASADLFKQHQSLFDKPVDLFMLYEPILGSESIQYQNGTEGKRRRNMYDKCFTFDAIASLYPCFQKVSDELSESWCKVGPDQHLPLSQQMFTIAIKAILLVAVGDAYSDDKEVLEFRNNYDICWAEMESRHNGNLPDVDGLREKSFQEALGKVKAILKKVVDDRVKNPPKQEGDYLLIDHVIELAGTNSRMINDDLITYIIGGFHTTGNLLTWAMYFLGNHVDLQDRFVEEIRDVLGSENVDHNSLGHLKYIRRVIDETMRCAVTAPWAARVRDVDSELGGYKIPKNTPVIQALGVAMKDETVFPEPDKFYPDRFLTEKGKKLPTLAFSPFGFAGKRMCPAYRFSYAEVTVILVTLLRKFKITLVEGQVVTPVYGFITHPKDEIWITISQRQ